MDSSLIQQSFDLCGITQNDYSQCHRQLVSLMDDGLDEMIVDESRSDGFRGFDAEPEEDPTAPQEENDLDDQNL